MENTADRPVPIRFRGTRPTIELAARLAGVPLSRFIRDAAMARALEKIQQACGVTSDAA